MFSPLERLDPYRWRLPRAGGMRVDGIVYADDTLMRDIRADESLQQVRNVAHLPGIVGASIAMPDIHWGYGFPIGGVAAMDADDGVVSPGGVGYDINCGVRLLRSTLSREEVTPRLESVVAQMYRNVPTGVGAHRKDLRVSGKDLKQVLEKGAGWPVSQGLGRAEDLETVEEHGCIKGADPDLVSERAEERGQTQLGTLGSGNHFAELQYVAEIYDDRIAAAFGLHKDQITGIRNTGAGGPSPQVSTAHPRV